MVNHYVSVRAETQHAVKSLQLPTQTVLGVSQGTSGHLCGCSQWDSTCSAWSWCTRLFGTQGYSADAQDNICDAARNTLESYMAF